MGVKSQTLLIRLEFDATIEEDAKFQLELVKMKMHFVDLVWVFFYPSSKTLAQLKDERTVRWIGRESS